MGYVLASASGYEIALDLPDWERVQEALAHGVKLQCHRSRGHPRVILRERRLDGSYATLGLNYFVMGANARQDVVMLNGPFDFRRESLKLEDVTYRRSFGVKHCRTWPAS